MASTGETTLSEDEGLTGDDTDRPDRAEPRSLVLVVDADPVFGLILEACLDFEGAAVEMTGSLAEGGAALRAGLGGLVVDRALPDGDGVALLALVAERCPDLRVVVCGDGDPEPVPGAADWPGARVHWLAKGDLARITEVLGLEPEHEHLPADRLLHISALDLDGPHDHDDDGGASGGPDPSGQQLMP